MEEGEGEGRRCVGNLTNGLQNGGNNMKHVRLVFYFFLLTVLVKSVR